MVGEYLRFMITVFVVFLLPVLILILFSQGIQKHLLSRRIHLKTADLLVPFLLVGIHLFSLSLWEMNIVLYFLLFLFSFGIFLAFYIFYKKKELYYVSFFRTWWRFVFLFSMLLFYSTGSLLIYSLLRG